MEKIYIAFVSTPGVFAAIIRKVLKQKYVHVALALDEDLNECYSIGRRHPSVPLLAGFEKENKRKILKKYPNAEYMICSVECTNEQKQRIGNILQENLRHRFLYHYTILGLPLILFQIPFSQRFFYTCSSYIAEVFEKCGVWTWEKHTSIVTPKDFMIHEGKEILFEGRLEEITNAGQEREYGTDLLYEQ